MGFSLSKVWKGVKKTFKKVGKGIKKAFQKYGKFMGKIGWLGQIAMTFIMPGIGSLLLKGLGSMLNLGTGITSLGGAGGLFANMAGSTNTFIRAAGKGLTAGYKVIADVTRPFTTVLDAVTTLGKTTVNKVGGVFGVTPFKGSAFSGYGKAFTSIGDDFSSMYDSKRWDALKNTTSNRETLNELQAMSDEKLAELGFDKGLKGATAVSEGFIDANRPEFSEYSFPGEVVEKATGEVVEKATEEMPYGISEYQYTEFDADSIGGVGRGSDVEVYVDVDPKSLLGDPTADTFKDKTRKSIEEMPSNFVTGLTKVPGEVVSGSAQTAAYQKIGLAPTVEDMYPEQERAKQGFGWIPTDTSQYAAMAQTQDLDPYDLWSRSYQEGDNNAISLIDGPDGGYGGWSRRFNAFAPAPSYSA